MHIYVCKHFEQKNKLYLTLTLTLTSQFCKIHMFVKIMIKTEKVIAKVIFDLNLSFLIF